MSLRVNPEAVAFAEEKIGDGHYRISTLWREAQPSEQAKAQFLADHGYEEYARWFLAEDTAQPEGSPARLQLPIGDFKSVHRNGLVAARDRANKEQLDDVAEAADELLFFFDRISAC